MIPTGGFSVLIHIGVILYSWLRRQFSYLPVNIPVPALLIGAACTGLIFYMAFSLFMYALNDDNNFDHVSFVLTSCKEQQYEPGARNIIIRVDDIQAYAWTDISTQMIEDAKIRSVPLVLGVIPIGLRDDFEFYTYLREERCFVEYALHGWDNLEPEPTVGEFAQLDEDEARDRLEKGINVIDRLARTDLVTFIPPLNQLSPGAHAALEELDFKVVSSYGDRRYDMDTSTFDFVIDEIVTLDRIVAECDAAFAAGEGECVIMMHPQDFLTDGELDTEKYALYIEVLDYYNSNDYTFVRFIDTLEE